MLKLKIPSVRTLSTNFRKRTVSKIAGFRKKVLGALVSGWKRSLTGRTVRKIADYISDGWNSGRKLTTIERGYTTVDSLYSIFLSDLEGTSMTDEFKAFIESCIIDKKYWYAPIKVFSCSGVLGMYARCEYSVVLILDGVPFIMSSRVKLEGTDEYDPEFLTSDNSVMAALMSENSNKVVSAGFIDPSSDVTKYVSEYIQKNPAIPSVDISFDLAKSFAKNDKMKYWGAIYKPGGYMYDIYSIDRTVSRAIRPNKEFGNDPLNEVDRLPEGMEVLLIGGEPDIVPLGTMANKNGMLFDVWIPNQRRYYKFAMSILGAGYIPNDIFVFDEDDMVENYAILMKALHVLDEEANGPEDDEDESSELAAVPMITDESLNDDDEVPVLIELPEYLI